MREQEPVPRAPEPVSQGDPSMSLILLKKATMCRSFTLVTASLELIVCFTCTNSDYFCFYQSKVMFFYVLGVLEE